MYFAADFSSVDVGTIDRGGPVLTGVAFYFTSFVNKTAALDGAGRILTDARTGAEARVCTDIPTIPENVMFFQTQLISFAPATKSECLSDCLGKPTCFSCGLSRTRTVSIKRV